ncbi:hypothetical protein BDW69DRAFT_201936 [Aspergillus filifer]
MSEHSKDLSQAQQENGNARSVSKPTNISHPQAPRKLDTKGLPLWRSRCDRQRPCASCSVRNLPCIYPEHSASVAPPGASSTGISAHERLAYLERLVMSMIPGPVQEAKWQPMAKAANQPDAPVKTPVDEQSDCGSMRTDDSELQYVGGDHWIAILDGIADLKDHLDRKHQLRLAESPIDGADEQLDDNHAEVANEQFKGALLLYGCRPASRKEILSSLPPKYAVDRYISRYFNYFDLVSSAAVHGPSFLHEYEAFWLDPSSAPITWVGLLFSMICLACLASEPLSGLEADHQPLQKIQSYREKIAQCLTLGQYTKPGPYVLETVVNYVYVEFGISPDANKDIWFLLGLEVNLAKLLMSDVLISNQMGMPRMISEGEYDTSEPRNLNDDDIDKDTQELPSPRSETEMTSSLGIIARGRMLKALGIIADLTDAVMPCPYSEVLRVDRILQEAAESIPPPMRVKLMAASLTDYPQVIVARLFVKHMYFKGQIMLHRRFCYMRESLQNEVDYSYSRKACLDACLGSLEIQHVLDEETRPDGQLYTMRWRVTSIMNHQFLTATMFLCSLLYPDRAVEREDEIRAALLRARAIWVRRSSFSKEAKKAAHTVSLVLSRITENSGPDGKQTENSTRGALAQRFRQVSFNWVSTVLKADAPMDLLKMPELMADLMPFDFDCASSSLNILDQTNLPGGWMSFINWPGSG